MGAAGRVRCLISQVGVGGGSTCGEGEARGSAALHAAAPGALSFQAKAAPTQAPSTATPGASASPAPAGGPIGLPGSTPRRDELAATATAFAERFGIDADDGFSVEVEASEGKSRSNRQTKTVTLSEDWNPFVAAHELGHLAVFGLTPTGRRIGGTQEADTVNEALADIAAYDVLTDLDGDDLVGRRGNPNLEPTTADWRCGTGPYANLPIITRAYALAADALDGPGKRDRAHAIWTRAVQDAGGPFATVADMREGLATAAAELYPDLRVGSGQTATQAVQAAFDAVGITDGWSPDC